MLSDARRVAPGATLRADLCIIGAGAAGITLARELIGTRSSVIVLESGGLEHEPETQALYEGRIGGLPYFPLEVARLRFLGGSTNHWGGVCRPFDPLDFETRDWIPFSGWPISRRDLDPYYGRAVEIVGLTSDDFSVESWDERDHQSPLDLGPDTIPRVAQLVSYDARSFLRYRDELERAGNLDVQLHANATEIEIDDAGGTVTGVEVATLSGNRFSVAAGSFVLAVGGIENPRLLLASNRRRPAGIGNQHDLVGRFFTEHPRFDAGVVAPTDADLRVGFYEPHEVDQQEIQGYVAFSPEVQAAEELVDVQIFVEPQYEAGFEAALDSEDVDSLRALSRGEGSIGDFGTDLMNVVADLTTFRDYTVPGAPLPVPYPDVVKELVESGDDFRARIPDLFGDVAALAYKRVKGTAPVDQLTLATRLDQAPNPSSRVTLTRSRDALGMPRAEVDWRLSSIDRRSAERAIEIAGAGFASAGLGRVRTLLADERGWPDDLAGGYHHIGTTRMSDDPKRGVVDRNCRVHGTSNLYVAGSSVFATGGSSTPTLTIVALALRLAEHLSGALR